MASKALTSVAFLLVINLLFFTLVSSTYTTPCPPPPPKGPKPHSPTPTSSPPPKTPTSHTPTPSSPSSPISPSPLPPTPTTPTTPTTPITPSPTTPTTPSPTTPTTPSPTTPTTQCPKDTLKLGVCANLLSNLVNLVIGTSATSSCCTLIGGLADLDAAVCLCTAIKAGVLGINLNIPVDLSLLLNFCGKKVPTDFQCA